MKDFEVYNDVGYVSLPSDEECVLTAPAIAKMLGEEDSVIRTWAKIHEQYLYIKKINGRFVYTQKSVEQFAFIQDLCRNKNFTHKQIHEHLSKKGYHYSNYDSGLIDPKDPLGYEALATQLMLKNQEMMKEFFMKFAEYQENLKEELKSEIRNEIGINIDEHIEDKFNEFKLYFDEKEMQQNIKDKELYESLKSNIECIKENTQQDTKQNENKGFFKKLFKL